MLVIGILSTYVSGLDRPHRAGATADTHARAHRDAVSDQHAAPGLYAVPNGYASPDSDTVVCGGVGIGSGPRVVGEPFEMVACNTGVADRFSDTGEPYWVFIDDGGWDYKGFYVSVFGFSAHKFVAGNCFRMAVVTVGGQEHLFGHICEGVRN